MAVLLETLTNQIHLYNIISCISEVEEVMEGESFESFVQDEETRMLVYRTLMMMGIEAYNVKQSNINNKLDLRPLISMKNADFINRLGKEYYSIFSFVSNDLPFYKTYIHNYLQAFADNKMSRAVANEGVIA